MALTRLSLTLAQLLAVDRRLEATRNLRRAIDKRLEELRESYFAILERLNYDQNFPAQYFDRVMHSVEDRLYNAATKQEVRVDELSFACTELVCGVVANRKNQVLRLVYDLDNHDFVFDTWSRGYYRTLVRLAASKQVLEIRRLFVYSKPEQLTDPDFVRLFDFHSRGPRFDCRLIAQSDWIKLARDLRIPTSYDDFGVWGDLILYTAVSARPDHIEGLYSSQQGTISQYTEFFEIGWNHARNPEPCINRAPMTLYELFEGKPPPAHMALSESAMWRTSTRFRPAKTVKAPETETGVVVNLSQKQG